MLLLTPLKLLLIVVAGGVAMVLFHVRLPANIHSFKHVMKKITLDSLRKIPQNRCKSENLPVSRFNRTNFTKGFADYIFGLISSSSALLGGNAKPYKRCLQ